MSFSLVAGFINAFIDYIPGDYKKNVHFTHVTNGELIEGWNPMTQKWESNSKEEWDNIEKRKGAKMKPEKTEMQHLTGMDLRELEVPELDGEGASTGRTKKVDMGNFTLPHDVKKPRDGKVHVQKKNTEFGDGLEEQELVVERFALKDMRGKLTSTVNKRFDKSDENYSETAEQAMVNHCGMAEKLAGFLAPDKDFDPSDLFKTFEVDDGKGGTKKEGGLLARIIGSTDGQGGFAKSPEGNLPTPETVMEDITDSAKRLKEGKGTGDDANKITQFIAAFVDGLTEVIEGSKTGNEQFEKIWPKFQKAFSLEEGDKEKLLERIEGYKKLAGGMSDTQSGKGTRKGVTRDGFMPDDPRYKIEEEDALIKGDISGSMHSQLLAQELSSTLFNDKGPKIKDPGESVQLVDKGLLNARAYDALMLTAGGKDDKGDSVFHTAFEMINGMQKITGCPRVSQKQSMEIMVMLRGGMTFTGAMEETFPGEKLSWMTN